MKLWKTTSPLTGLSMYLCSRIELAELFDTRTGMPASKIGTKRLGGRPQPWDTSDYLAISSLRANSA
ncbi:MAG: hypothetical protein FJ012_04205 [Chloroflexi bacterium]|nr:hypothetical protein [Chloroflexota bacterium]